jgi:hypothetical protein
MEKLVLDTSILVEYIVKRAPYRSKVANLFDKALKGEVELYVSPITLSETLYITSRIYEAASLHSPNDEALNYITWLKGRIKTAKINGNIAIRAGELKKSLHIAFPDCYTIAIAEIINAISLFKTVEKEMKPIQDKLKKLRVKFLDEDLTP